MIDNITSDKADKEEFLSLIGEKNIHGIIEKCNLLSVPEEKITSLKELLSLHGTPEEILPKLKNICGNIAKSEIEVLDEVLTTVDNDTKNRIQIDFSIIGDINYYNGIIFNGFISGIPGKVLSGGQYDKLMLKMNRKSKAIGFAVYLDQLERISLSN